LVYRLKAIGLVKDIKVSYYLAIIINKCYRFFLDKIYSISKKNPIKIYACHGACFFIGYEAVEKLKPLYNENMFLFHEEEHLAKKTMKESIPIYYEKNISLTHFEDGSSEGIKDKTYQYLRQSYSEYYQYWKCEAGDKF